MVTPRIGQLRLRMVPLFLLLALAGGSLSLAGGRLTGAEPARDARPADEMNALVKARIALARKGHEAALAALRKTRRAEGVLLQEGKPEDVYQWSVRWLQAEQDLSPREEHQIAALEAHLKRMTELEKEVKMLAKDLLPRRAELDVEWYRLEAQLWLAKAKGENTTLRLIQPQVRNISRTVGQPSFVEGYERTSIHAKVTGYIEKWKVDIGDKVKKGDVLATLFVPELREDWETKKATVQLDKERVELARKVVKVAQADVKSAEARLVEAKALLAQSQAVVERWEVQVKRIRREVERGIVDAAILGETENQFKASIASRDAAKAAIHKAEAELLSRQATLEQDEVAVKVAQGDLGVAESDAKRLAAWVSYLTLTAPYDGVIVARNANTWDFVTPPGSDATAQNRGTQPGPRGVTVPIYVIDRVDIVRVFVDVPEQDANFVQTGNKATVLIRAYRDQPIPGTVTRTSWALNVRSRTLRAEIDLPNKGGQILPGMYAYGKIFCEHPRVRALPLSAIDSSGEKSFYWACKNGRAVRMEVETGATDGTWIEVARRRLAGAEKEDSWEPIDGSEQVLLGDLSDLSNGQPVRVAKPQAP